MSFTECLKEAQTWCDGLAGYGRIFTSIVIEALGIDGELHTRWDIDAPLTIEYIDANHNSLNIRLLIALMQNPKVIKLKIVNPAWESRL